ncbi:hypothetical protein O181_017473 [Austropuccinia psidii MF-1]|uniref:Uncharacterized protein n=1 Tax=Austropuccinia psidii MF-1 TaxID=1389203 RepID=A0A9Q3GRU0_9BASI|nr:hypothetical protein [Austropuccinia psidii MF-1]
MNQNDSESSRDVSPILQVPSSPMRQEASNHLWLRTPTPSYKLLKSNLLRDLTTRSLAETLDKTNIDPLTSKNYAKWSNKVKMALTIKNIDIFFKPNWISSLPNDAPEEEVEFFQNSFRQIYFWLGNTLDHIYQENYDKFFDDDQENYNSAALWLNICDFYAASSVENCATVMTNLFGMKIEDGIVSNSIIEIRHQSKLLKSTGQDLFEEKTMSCMLAFYYLRNLPTSLSFVKNNIYQEIKISKHYPTLVSLLSDIELALARNQELSIPDGQALCIGERRIKCKNGKHSPEAPHSEDQCFQLHPHLLKEFRERRNQDKHSKVTSSTTKSTGLKPMSSPGVYCISTESKRTSFIKEERSILDSGASHLLLKDSERFVSFTKTRVALN